MAHSKLVLYDGLMQRKLGLELFNKYTLNRHARMSVRINDEMFDDTQETSDTDKQDPQSRRINNAIR